MQKSRTPIRDSLNTTISALQELRNSPNLAGALREYEAADQRYCSDLVLEAARAMDGFFATVACEMHVEGKPETYLNEVTCAIDGNLSFALMEAADQLDADEAERRASSHVDDWIDTAIEARVARSSGRAA